MIKSFPKTTKDEEILAFLKEIGGEDLDEGTEIKFEKNDKNIMVSIESLTPGTVQNMIKNTDLVKNTTLVEKLVFGNSKPAEEIKSSLFGNLGEADHTTEKDGESEDVFENISQRFEFLKNGEEVEDKIRGQKQKRGRNNSSPNSGSKHKNKKYKNVKNKDDKI